MIPLAVPNLDSATNDNIDNDSIDNDKHSSMKMALGKRITLNEIGPAQVHCESFATTLEEIQDLFAPPLEEINKKEPPPPLPPMPPPLGEEDITPPSLCTKLLVLNIKKRY